MNLNYSLSRGDIQAKVYPLKKMLNLARLTLANLIMHFESKMLLLDIHFCTIISNTILLYGLSRSRNFLISLDVDTYLIITFDFDFLYSIYIQSILLSMNINKSMGEITCGRIGYNGATWVWKRPPVHLFTIHIFIIKKWKMQSLE
jgi:hypothetical protein